MSDERCTCNHLASQHNGTFSACRECECPGVTDDRSFIPAMVNDRWHLMLPPHRAYRTALPWFESARLASMWHGLVDHGFADGNQVVYDIGSEEGDFPALWASWGCEVVLVEPNPKAWPWIRRIFEENRLGYRVRGWWVALAGAETRGAAVRSSGSRSWPECADELVPTAEHGFHHLAEHHKDPVITIDAMVVEHGPPTAITIDVEGAEWQVLQGAKETIEQHRPKVWVSIHEQFAWDLYGIEHVTAQVREFFQDRGYREHYLATDHEAHWFFEPC